jgi:hypothetical protein
MLCSTQKKCPKTTFEEIIEKYAEMALYGILVFMTEYSKVPPTKTLDI